MTCPHTENISYLIDGELSSAEVLRLERHVNECLECQQARSDFLNLRSQIVAFDGAIDRPASERALAEVLAKIHVPTAMPARSTNSPGLFSALRFKPVFAALALLVLGGVFSFLIYRNTSRQVATNQSKGAEGSISDQKGNKASSPTPASEASPSPSTANTDDSVKSDESKKPKQKSGPPVEVPKMRKAPTDLISPWSNQAIAVNTTPEEIHFEPDDAANEGTLTMRHLGQSELLLRSFRNIRTAGAGSSPEVGYERRRAQRLVYQNILLRREADAKGDVQLATLLDSLEPILLDIANLPERPLEDDVRAIKERLQRKNLVAMLQVNSTVLARANE